MANDEPSMKIEGCTFEPRPPDFWTKYPKRMAMQAALRRALLAAQAKTLHVIPADTPLHLTASGRKKLAEWTRFHPATPLTGLALRLFAVSNGFHECRSDRIV